MLKQIFILSLLLILATINLKSQTVPSPTESNINIEILNPEIIPDEILDTLSNPILLVTSSDTVIISATMLLDDTNVVSKIHIKLGTSLGANDLLEQTFNYDDLNLSAPQNYLREEEMITITFGKYLYLGVFYCEIILEDNMENLSEITNCQSDQ